LRLGYPEFQAHDTEVIAISSSTPDQGARYHQLFHFVHPYLCDPELATARRYGVPFSLPRAFGGVLGSLLKSPALLADMRKNPAGVSESGEESKAIKTGKVDSLFVIDKQGLVRFARANYGTGLLPSNSELLRLLGGLASAA
jgi:alkyl hydroperoxide reductase subunit AhpC